MFTHLHTHSHYSLLQSLATLDQLIAQAKADGATALALTDHGVMYGVIEFYQKCQATGLKPIIGLEAYISPGSLHDRNHQEKPYHLILLAQDYSGYKNLMKLSSIAHLEGYHYYPRLDWSTLQAHHQGLLASTACAEGPLARHILAGQPLAVEKNLSLLLDIFGPDRLYLEMQFRKNPEQKIINQELKKLAHKHNLPLIVTNDVHYIQPAEAEAQDVLLCIQTKHKQVDKTRLSYLNEDYSFYSEEKIKSLLPEEQEAITNTQKLADRCQLEIEVGKIQLPRYELPEGVTADEELRRLSLEGVKKRFGYEADQIAPKVKERLEYELSVITKTGFATYFLIVQDFVNWAKEQKIIVGPGRGSAAGSLVSYLIGITNLDPLRYDLLFERFLNPDRVTMPDIDLDFADNRRNEVIEYVEKKYGKDHVAQIITFGTMAARASIRDVGRVLGY